MIKKCLRRIFEDLLFWGSVFFALLLYSCNNTNEKIPDVSNINVSLQTSRFDLDLYAIDTNHIGEGLQKLKVKYPDFLNYFLDTVMAYGINGNYSDTTKGVREGLRPFLCFKDFKGLEDTIKKYYPDSKETDKQTCSELDEPITDAFRFMKYYFPACQAPRIIYLNMGLSNWPSFPLDKTTFCIGLDMFLGDQFPYYKSIGVPGYMLSHVRKSYLPVSLFSTIYRSMHPFNSDDKTLLDLIIQRGKEQYFLHKIFPRAADSLLFGFTQLQVNWCKANEASIYNFFIHENLLYNKESHNIMPYINDGPFAKGLEASTDTVKYTPGNIGAWLGYKIVSAYMAQHPDSALSTLLNQQTDPAKFLDDAKYRPR
jgi:hypothetical protein